jgi:hypothetical protein
MIMRKLEILVFTALVILVVIILLGWGAWHLVSTYVSVDVARVWALAATILLPVALVTGRSLGFTESRGRLDGIDKGMERLTKAAEVMRPIVRQPRYSQPPMWRPQETIIIPRLASGGEEEL